MFYIILFGIPRRA